MNEELVLNFIAQGCNGYPWSSYQVDLIWQVFKSTESIIVSAVPGSGKTTVLADLLAKILPMIRKNASFLFLAFNNSIQAELKDRLPANFNSTGINKLGYAILRNHTGQPWNSYFIDGSKTYKLVSSYIYNLPELTDGDDEDRTFVKSVISMLSRTMDLCLSSNISPLNEADFEKLISTHSLPNSVREWTRELAQLIKISDLFAISTPKQGDGLVINAITSGDIDRELGNIVLAKCGNYTRQPRDQNKTWISFTDQIRIPVLYNMTAPAKYDVILVDEAQDFNGIMLGLLKLISKPTTQVVAVGDPNQAIYGFAGALSDSMQVVQKTFNAVEMPLHQTYRLPVTHVEYAKSYLTYGNLVGFKTNQGLLVEDLDKDDIVPTVQAILKRNEEVLILSGRNAHVTKAAFKLLANGIPCNIINRDFVAVVSLVKNVAYRGKYLKRGVTMKNLPEKMQAWYQKERKALLKIDACDDDLQLLADKLDTFETFYNNVDADTPDEFLAIIADMFKDANVSVRLSTPHRAKGLECQNVIVVEAQTIMYPREGLSEEQLQQFRNVGLVAFTRSSENMYISSSDESTYE